MDLDHIFAYHAPGISQTGRFQELRLQAKQFAKAILKCTPAGADQSAAIRKVREALMTANAAIALEQDAPAGLDQAEREQAKDIVASERLDRKFPE
jgi:hypothetical protein